MIRYEREASSVAGAAPGSGVALLLIDRPDKRNALTPPMMLDLASGARRAEADGARALVVGGSGQVFCSGFDLSLCNGAPDMMAQMLRALSDAIRALRSLSIPVVGAAHGAAIAGGCALLTGCDFVLTDAQAKLGYPVVRLGVSPAVTSPTLRQMVEMGRTREMLLSPVLRTGAEAGRMGLAHAVLPTPDGVLPAAYELAASLSAKPPLSLSATKNWLNELDGSLDTRTLDAALDASLALAGGPEEQIRLADLWAPAPPPGKK